MNFFVCIIIKSCYSLNDLIPAALNTILCIFYRLGVSLHSLTTISHICVNQSPESTQCMISIKWSLLSTLTIFSKTM